MKGCHEPVRREPAPLRPHCVQPREERLRFLADKRYQFIAFILPSLNRHRRLCTSSDEMSMNIETNPSTQIPPGNAR